MRHRTYDKQQLENAVKNNTSYSGVVRSLGLAQAGGTHAHIRRLIKDWNFDVSHFIGKGWNKGKEHKPISKLSSKAAVRKRLIVKRSHRCEECKLTNWNAVPITLEVHHVDGNKRNNKETNLQLLCPNCHALTSNWRR